MVQGLKERDFITNTFGRYVDQEIAEELMRHLRAEMGELLDEVQRSYDHPEGAYWVPRRLGGGAPTMEEAIMREEAELAERARRELGDH